MAEKVSGKTCLCWTVMNPLTATFSRSEMNIIHPQSDSSTPEVNWDDQQRINAFGRLNTQRHELQAEIKAKKARAM